MLHIRPTEIASARRLSVPELLRISTAFYDGSPSYRQRRYGRVLLCSGQSGERSYASRNQFFVCDASDLSIQTGAISFWVNPDDYFANTHDIIHVFESGNAYSDFLLIRLKETGRIGVYIEDEDVSILAIATDSVLSKNRWHHVLIAQDGIALKTYVNCELDSVDKPRAPAPWMGHLTLGPNLLRIGGASWGSMIGILDALLITDWVPTPEQVKTCMSRAQQQPDPEVPPHKQVLLKGPTDL